MANVSYISNISKVPNMYSMSNVSYMFNTSNMFSVNYHLTTSLCSVSCYESPRMLGDGAEVGLVSNFSFFLCFLQGFKEKPLWLEVSIPLCLGVTGGGQTSLPVTESSSYRQNWSKGQFSKNRGQFHCILLMFFLS